MKVRIERLRKEFGSTLALDDISFAFDSGHVFGFVGPNGAGKTTTMRIIATLDEPTGGDVYINGSSVREEPEAARRLVGYVPDALPTHSDITVHEYLDFFGRAYGLRGRPLRDAVAGVEEFTNLGGIRDKLIRSLSKGMKQRVSLGRALIFDPQVLVLDEPAAGLDPRARVELRELMGLLAQRNKAILISSHILTELTEICNGVVIIERGKILETGTIEDVLQKRSPKRTVAIRALDPPADLIKQLLQIPNVDNAREVAAEVHIDVNGSEADACEILAQLVRRGCRISEFKQTREDLEDLFMKVTKGGVQ
jgi:ABC-2 type transport system ATP-binding protein